MSSDKHSLPPSRYRCEAISSEVLSLPSSHGPWSLRRKPTDLLADDPATLISQALGHVRQGDGLTGYVPTSILSGLQRHADRGNPACCLLLDWIARRNRDLLAPPQADPVRQHQSKPRMARRLVRERRQALPGAGSLKLRKATSQEAVRDPKTAIIAATEGGGIDG